MEFYNILENKIEVDKRDFLNAVNSGEYIGITPKGKVVRGKEGKLPRALYIFAGKPKSLTGNGVTRATPLKDILGENYVVKDDGEKITIDASKAWEQIMEANGPYCSYMDLPGEGISEFSHKELEDLLWYSCEFDISYREVAEYLESCVDGEVVCIERSEPYQFSGCALIKDPAQAASKGYEFIKKCLKERIERGEIELEELSDGEEEALSYYGLK